MAKKKKSEVVYELLREDRSPDIEKLVNVYKKDRYMARIVFMNSQGDDKYQSRRLGMFTEKNGDFNIVLFIKSFGINKNNVMYSNERREVSISYKDGKFYTSFRTGSSRYVNQLTRCNLSQNLNSVEANKVKMIFIEKFSWLRHLCDEELLLNTSFNKITRDKIFSLKKAISYEYGGIPYPVAKMFHKYKVHGNRLAYIKTYLGYIKNVENFNKRWLDNNHNFDIFWDTLKMGRILNKQINCSWSEKRLKAEHDKWAKDITDVVFAYDNREMRIDKLYQRFQEFSDFEMITDTRGMALEGRRQNHCVATYVSSVDYGHCAIYKVGDYTLEVRKIVEAGQFILVIGQLRGYGNKSAPKDLEDNIVSKLKEFNKNNGVDASDEVYHTDYLPF